MIKTEDGYKLDIETPETMKLFGSINELIEKTKKGENMPSIQVVEVVLLQCSLAENQYQRKSHKSIIYFNS